MPDDAFGADLYGQLPSGNLVFSPASIAAMLRLVLLGARGQTAAQLAAALHEPAQDEPAQGEPAQDEPAQDEPAQGEPAQGEPAQGGPASGGPAVRARLAALPAAAAELTGSGITLAAPTTLWLQEGFPVKPEYTAAVTGLAGVAVRAADFEHDPERARRAINALIAEQTAGRISGLLGPGAVISSSRLVLASAVYLKAAWAQPFPATATGDAPFYPDYPAGTGAEAVPGRPGEAGGLAGQEAGAAGKRRAPGWPGKRRARVGRARGRAPGRPGKRRAPGQVRVDPDQPGRHVPSP